ncbi:FadR/GntR family transcriptional regulator [Clostridium sp. Marseille-P2415]|uniref:FadR/GntR family transcriptional regulator n=1 Tax=Clostridium sp. Marseille-P2415 TaxID=1805471 RepID=UPI001F3CB122|nr:FadR/GntR family transcriptional regulator [Clostridium sp. Marseille-P2415]
MDTSNHVLNVMQEKIISGEWKPGMKITGEMQLAQELGVSRASVREAMKEMVAMGVFTRRRGDGTYINDISSGMMFQELLPDMMLSGYSEVEILDFREMLEPECVRRFTGRFEPEQLQRLQECCDIMEKNAIASSKKFAQADLEFHLILVQGSGNPVMIKVMDIIKDILAYYQFSANELIGPKTGVTEHRRILEAIEAKDEELAALLMHRHIQRSKRDIIERIKDESKE